MAYSNFTPERVQDELKIKIRSNQSLFATDIKPISVSSLFKQTLERFAPLAVGSEKAKSEFIIAPTLAELHARFEGKLSLLSGIALNVDSTRGLEGLCDFIISAGAQQFFLTAPIFVVVEAKKDDILGGLGQCIATLYAAMLFNKKAERELPALYGVVTNSQIWQFVKLQDQTAFIDRQKYFIGNLELLLGILSHIIETIQKDISN